MVAAARNPDSDLRSAEIALLDAELKREQALQALESARMSLAATWGAKSGFRLGCRGYRGPSLWMILMI